MLRKALNYTRTVITNGSTTYLELLLVSIIVTLISSIHYFIEMVLMTSPGLVLDDSYIHLQFARTVFEGRPWQYNIGEPSTGSTSPLWAIALSPVFLLPGGYDVIVWGVLYTTVFYYTLCTYLVGYISYTYTKSKSWSVVTILGFVLVPRNTMLMLSGMETPLFMFLILLSIALLDKPEPKYDPLIGIVAGLAFLARPEGVLIAAVLVPVRFVILAVKRQLNRSRIIPIFLMFCWMALIASFYVMYCLIVTGHPLPATFYAKAYHFSAQGVIVWTNHWTRWLKNYSYISIGLIAGLYLVFSGKPHTWLFSISLMILYVNTLPYFALINNARYLVPVFDLLIISAILAIAMISMKVLSYFKKVRKSSINTSRERIAKLLTLSFALVVIFSSVYPGYLNQANLFAREVLDTNDRQIILGRWIKAHTPENAVLAIHDAGAIKYFSERKIIDLAGLITPDITFSDMTRPEKLGYLKAQGCEYFVFFDRLFNNWAPYLRGAYTKICSVYCPEAILKANANMSIYWINWTLTNY